MENIFINKIEEHAYFMDDEGDDYSEESYYAAVKFFKENYNFPKPRYADCIDGDFSMVWENFGVIFNFWEVGYWHIKDNNEIETGSVRIDELKSLLERILVAK